MHSPFDGISVLIYYFYHSILLSNTRAKLFLIKLIISTDYTVESQESRNEDSASNRLGGGIGSRYLSHLFGALRE